jgi:group I intron endonuclease
MGLIYMRTSPSGKYYIGKTTRTEEVRWKEHSRKAFNPNEPDYTNHLSAAIRKYGAENFSLTILEENISDDLLSEKEKYYIEKYDAQNPEKGYNRKTGGESETIYSDTFILELWNSGKTIKDIKTENNMNYNNLSRRLYGLGITKEEINHRAYSQNNKKKKAVIQYDLFGNYIQTFNSIADAAREIGSNTTNISAVCKGRRNSCKDFIFRYKGD